MTDAVNFEILSGVEQIASTLPAKPFLTQRLLRVDGFRDKVTMSATTQYARSLAPRIYDRRVGKMLSLDYLPLASQLNSNANATSYSRLAEQTAEATTVLHSGDTPVAGEIGYFLPLARSASDPSPVVCQIRMWEGVFDASYRCVRLDKMTVKSLDAPTTHTNVYTLATAPCPPFFAYDLLRKTFVYLGGRYGASSDTAKPDYRNEVFEVWGGKTVTTVAGVTSLEGFLTYVADETRFVHMGIRPGLLADLAFSFRAGDKRFYRSARLGMLNQKNNTVYTTNNQYHTDPSSESNNTAIYTGRYANPLHNNTLSWALYYGQELADGGAPANSDPTIARYKTMPLLVIEGDGSVNVYTTFYEPELSDSYVEIPATQGSVSTAQSYFVRHVKGYTFRLVDHTGAVLHSGRTPVPESLVQWYSDHAYAAGKHVQGNYPVSVNPVTGAVETIYIVKTAPGPKTGPSGDQVTEYPSTPSETDARYRNAKINADIYLGYAAPSQ